MKMNVYEKLLHIKDIYERLQDNISRQIFNAKLDYLNNPDGYADAVYGLCGSYFSPQLEHALKRLGGQPQIIIYGSGNDGKRTRRLLCDMGYTPYAFCETTLPQEDKNETEGLKVYSVNSIINELKDVIIILSSRRYADEMHRILLDRGFPEERIFHPHPYDILEGLCGNQYFDVIPPKGNEVFVDAGCWNGGTTESFMRYCSNDCKKVYAFEPLSSQIDVIKKRCMEHGWQNVEIINAAAWDREDMLHFHENTTDSTICSSGSAIVKAIDIDSTVGDDTVTFIKMDIEGAELHALQGARKTILKNKPTLAIAVYHKSFDIIDIPLYIMELYPNCKFYLRQYSSMWTETVLYAVAE